VVDVLLWRGGKFYIGKVRVEASRSATRPDAPAPMPEPPPAPLPGNTTSNAVGLVMADLTADTIKQLKLPKEIKGVSISTVTKNGLADKSGLTGGMVVLKVDKTTVISALMFEQALKQADTERGALLQVMKANGDVDFVILRLK
jgi:serine protease Do